VHAGAFVSLRNIGKPVGGFNLEHAKNIHGRIVPPMADLRNHFLIPFLNRF
jgi:hypothetical protein